MRISSLLYSALFSPISQPILKNTETCSIKFDLVKIMLYEAYIPIDAMVFEIGTSKMNKREVRKIVNTILDVKKNILDDPMNIQKIYNLSEEIGEKGPMRVPLLKRQALIKRDESYIFKDLIKSKQEEILACVDRFKDKKLEDPKLDQEYREMMDRLYDAVYENLNIQDVINREKDELFRDYKENIPEEEFKRARIALSLGSTIFYLPDLLKVIAKIDMVEKKKFVTDQVNIMFEEIEKLAIETASRNLVQQKALAIDFINSSTESGPSNNAFEFRDAMVRAAKLTKDEIYEISGRQSKENRRILEAVKNMKSAPWIVKYNKQIKEDMITFLLTQQSEDKKKVLNHFS